MNIFKSEQQIIAEIHDAFDSAQERLLEEATRIIKESEPKGIIKEIDVAERLKKVGFTQTQLVRNVDSQLKDRDSKNRIIVENREQAELIQYYKRTYPFMKFLTESELDRICDKYNLIHAPVANYIGDVPEKNLRDIERAQRIVNGDECPILTRINVTSYWHGVSDKVKNIFDKGFYYPGTINKVPYDRDIKQRLISEYGCVEGIDFKDYIYDEGVAVQTIKHGLFIAAPAKEFNLKGLTKKGKHWYNILTKDIEDPIVFRYVRGGIQIITKWGLEASDEALRNEIDN